MTVAVVVYDGDRQNVTDLFCILFCLLFFIIVLPSVLLSEHIERFSVFLVQDFLFVYKNYILNAHNNLFYIFNFFFSEQYYH